MELALLSDGPTEALTTNSGVAAGVLNALRRTDEVRVVATVDVSLTRLDRVAVRVLSFRPTRYSWDRAAGWGLWRPLIRSLKRSRNLRRTNATVLHIRNFYFPSRNNYAPFLDTTLSLREKLWPEPELKRRHYRILQLLERAYLQRAKLVFVAGEHVRDEIISRYGLSTGKVIAVGAGLNFSARAISVRSRGPSETFRVLFVGKEFRRKGGDLLLASVMQMREHGYDIKLTIVGPDALSLPATDALEFRGRIDDPEELSRLYGEAHVFGLPAAFEPYGLVILEALAHSLPIIASCVCELPRLIQDGVNGYIVEREVDSVVAALSRLYCDDALRLQMSRAAHRSSMPFSWDAVAQKIVIALSSTSDEETGP